MKELNGVEEIVEHISDLMNRPNGKYQLARMYGLARTQQEKYDKEKEIQTHLKLSSGERVEEVTFIGEEIAIAEVHSNRKDGMEKYYHPVVNGKRCFEVADTFDRALAIALGEKYGVRSYAPQAIVSILRIDEYEARKKKLKTFIDMVVDGEDSLDNLDNAIEQWNAGLGGAYADMELTDFLGLSHYEYQEGVMHNKREVLDNVVELRKNFKK